MAIQERDVDKNNIPRERYRDNNGRKYLWVVLASVLSTLGLVAGGFWLYQRLASKDAIAPVTTVSPSISPTVEPPAASPLPSVGIQPGQFVQPALGNKAQIELITVRRVLGAPNEVTVEMRINRLSDNVGGSDIISPGSTTARNPITNETYYAVDVLNRSSGSTSLYQLSRGQPQEAYVVLNVPAGVNTIDVFVENTGVFRNVPIADASANPVSRMAPAPPAPINTAPISPVPQSQVPYSTASAPRRNVGILPGQFVQPALGTKAQVELLSVKRVADPELRTRDVVNVQMRVRRLATDNIVGSDIISVGGTTARNPVTSETYKAVDLLNRSTGNVSLYLLRPQASGDAYVWLRVPEGTNTLDIYIPETQAFKNVPISN